MSRKKDKHGNGDGQYVNLQYSMLRSPAWRSLSGAAMKVWFELHTRYHGGNNGSVRLSMNEAVKAVGISKGTAQRAFVELQEKGFIVLQSPGNWYHRRAHEWRLTTKRTQVATGVQLATNEWRHWRPQKQNAPDEGTRDAVHRQSFWNQ